MIRLVKKIKVKHSKSKGFLSHMYFYKGLGFRNRYLKACIEILWNLNCRSSMDYLKCIIFDGLLRTSG